MMFSPLFASNTLEQWLFITVFVLMLGSTIGLLVWGAILEIRYISPFTLIKSSSKEKWRGAVRLALLQTAMLPIFGITSLILYTSPEKLAMFFLCNGLWIVALPVASMYKRWEFERHIQRYRKLDKMIKDKNSVYHRYLSTPVTSMTKIFMTADQKRFFSEGFPDDIDEKKDGKFANQQSGTSSTRES